MGVAAEVWINADVLEDFKVITVKLDNQLSTVLDLADMELVMLTMFVFVIVDGQEENAVKVRHFSFNTSA